MGYGTVARLFHWTTVLLILVMIPVGILMTQDIPRPLQDRLFVLHKGLGPLVLVVVLARLAWRAFHAPTPLPPSVPPLQARLAGLVHAGLYFFLILQAVSGYVRVTTGGFPIEALRALGIPPLLPVAKGVGEVASTVHSLSVVALIVLIAMHVGAAAFHGIVKRDGVFSRMWPPIAPQVTPRGAAAPRRR